MSKHISSWRDYSQELSTVEFNFADIAAGGGNFDAVKGLSDAFGAAVAGVSLCVQATEKLSQVTDPPDASIPNDVYAQREIGLRVFYEDTVTGKQYHITIPGPDLDNIDLLAGTDLADLTDTPVSALVAAMEAGLSPDGNAVSVLRAVVVGRNN